MSAEQQGPMSHQMPITAGAGGNPPSQGAYSMPAMHSYQHTPPSQPPPQYQQQHSQPPLAHHLQHHAYQQQQQQHSLQHQQPAQPSDGQPVGEVVTHQMLLPYSRVDESTGRKYHLDVVQQPKRARMCGFGDKDRRPITPPPCVRLVVTDVATGKEVDVNDIDHSMFVLNVDLWSEDALKEVNLVRSSSGAPSISSTTPYSYSSLNSNEPTTVGYQSTMLPPSRDSAYSQSSGITYVQEYQVPQAYAAPVPSTFNGSFGPPHQYFPAHQVYRSDTGLAQLPSQASMANYRNGHHPGYAQDVRLPVGGTQPSGMFTRNLIGSLAASAFRLSDTSDRIGIWFVLQDLSVRTEGPFRLRFSFVNVGLANATPRDGNKVNRGRAPILASCFSEVFNVYSAKKFPGVCESTALSKTFATQGIKIPIRKDTNMRGGEGGDDDYE